MSQEHAEIVHKENTDLESSVVSEVLCVFSVFNMSVWGLVKPGQSLLPTHDPGLLDWIEALKVDNEVFKLFFLIALFI